eukprot:GILJ01010939.1.p1 GENE.GILJ01010939.1~~GILJ01010939.1.p1  ORF type:complete len:874 (-),score=137.51 GILJ01010939.1:141-2762(-)
MKPATEAPRIPRPRPAFERPAHKRSSTITSPPSSSSSVPSTLTERNARKEESPRRAQTMASSHVQKLAKEQEEEEDEEVLDKQTVQHKDGIPIHAVLHVLMKQRRHQQIRKIGPYLLFLFGYIWIILQLMPAQESFNASDGVFDELAQAEINAASFQKNFYSVKSHLDFWEWFLDPFYAAIYTNIWYSGDLLPESNQLSIKYYNRMMCPVQIRQARVKVNSCAPVNDATHDFRFPCYGAFAKEYIEKGPWLSDIGVAFQSNLSWWEGKTSYGAAYGKSSYVIELPLDPEAALATQQKLFNNTFTDLQTRGLALNVVTYNPSSDLTILLRLNMDWSSGGRIESDYQLWILRLLPYNSATDYMRAVVEIGVLLYVVYGLFEEAYEISIKRVAYFKEFWNWIEMVTLILMFIVAVIWMSYMASPLRKQFTKQSDTFMDIIDLAEQYRSVINISSMAIIFCLLKTFKYLEWSKRMHLLFDVLLNAGGDLLPFFATWLFIVFGFVFGANILFGYQLQEFHSVDATFSAMLRTLVGELSYDDWRRASEKVAPVLIMMWIGIVILILTNMFIAIITDFFEDMKKKQEIQSQAMSQYLYAPLAVDSLDRALIALDRMRANIRLYFSRNKVIKQATWRENPMALLERNTWSKLSHRLKAGEKKTMEQAMEQLNNEEEDEKTATEAEIMYTKPQVLKMRKILWDGIAEANRAVRTLMDGEDLYQILIKNKIDQWDGVIRTHHWNKLLKKKINGELLVETYHRLKPSTVDQLAVSAMEEPLEMFDEKIDVVSKKLKRLDKSVAATSTQMSKFEYLSKLNASHDEQQKKLALDMHNLSQKQSDLSQKLDRVIASVVHAQARQAAATMGGIRPVKETAAVPPSSNS